MTAQEARDLTKSEDWHLGAWMQTHSGRKFYPLAPRPEDIDPGDIAHALSLLCRYNGHVDRFYSVAEHCVLMSSTFEDPHLALWALLHDATEAYVGDMVRPLKRSMPAYCEVEDRVMAAIVERFRLEDVDYWAPAGEPWVNVTMPPAVKDADNRILLAERAALMSNTTEAWAVEDLIPLPVQVEGWGPAIAEAKYLERLYELWTEAAA